MARTMAGLPAGTRLTDHISLGVLTASFPIETVQEALLSTGRVSQRERDLPAPVMVYYAMALALYADVSTREVLRCLLAGVRWLGGRDAGVEPAGPSGISQARTRLGAAPLEERYRTVVAPVAVAATPAAWYRGWRVMRPDGPTLRAAATRAPPPHLRRPRRPPRRATAPPIPRCRGA